jgi:anti-sigma regulatory factor (Ser/Thr protein kinase)
MSSTPSTPFEEALTVPANVNHLRHVTKLVNQAALQVGFSGSQLNRIELAVDEACSNIIQHAYTAHTEDTGFIHIRIYGEPRQRITIVLIDNGQPFDLDSVPTHNPEAPLEEVKIGGLGLFLIRQTMDEVHFEFDLAFDALEVVDGVAFLSKNDSGKFNRLTLIKNL